MLLLVLILIIRAKLTHVSSQIPEKFKPINRLNRGIDRAPAVKGKKDPSKLRVVLKLPGGKPDKILQFLPHNKGTNLDWDNADHIRQLNRYRSQSFRFVFLALEIHKSR